MTRRSPQPPLVTIGRYGSHGATTFVSGLAVSANAQGQMMTQTFEDDLHTLQTGDTASNDWIRALNTYANVVTACICAQDGRKPAKVCGTHGIRYIMSRIK